MGHLMSRPSLTGLVFGVLLIAPDAIQHCIAGEVVTVDLQGEIKAECSLTVSSNTFDLGSVSETGVRTIPFRLRCNAPYSYEIRSQNGGLRNAQVQTLSRGFKALIPYTAITRIPTNTADIADTCFSTDLTPPVLCKMSDSGDGISIDRDATLSISWQMDDEVPLAGTYRDVITLSFHARY
jgi:hypothetical protein